MSSVRGVNGPTQRPADQVQDLPKVKYSWPEGQEHNGTDKNSVSEKRPLTTTEMGLQMINPLVHIKSSWDPLLSSKARLDLVLALILE
jgi:hypothetical protein